MDKKPNVFNQPSFSDAMKDANEVGTKIAEQLAIENEVVNSKKSQGELEAAAQMAKDSMDKLEAQLKARDELVRRKAEEAKGIISEDVISETPTITYPKYETSKVKVEISEDERYERLSQPQYDAPFDILPLPSEGLLYKNGKSGLKVAFLNASDENILTNPNLLQSGKFLDILLNRKILDGNIRYKDLHVGDRNAIMVWLRATGYGPMYKIILNNPNDPTFKEFEAEVDLSKLGIKKLGARPDENGLFEYKLPMSGNVIKFRLLTVGDLDDITDYLEKVSEEDGREFTDASTYTLKKQIKVVNDDSDEELVGNFINRMRLGDVRSFRSYVEEIESGVDMNITVGIPGGGSLNTFLPLNLSFFWPDI